MIQIQALSFAYGKNKVLTDVSLTFEKGRLYAIVGPNGSGKTTLLHTIAGLHKGTGRLSIDGRDHDSLGRRDFAQRLAILLQNRHTPDMSVFELVSAGRYPYRDFPHTLSQSDLTAVREALHFTDTERLAGQSLKKLSGGECQRAYLAMLCAQDTPYVLLDEPTTHLDISHGFEIMHILTQMSSNGKCIVAVLHDLPLALKYADEIIVLSEGRVVSVATPAETAKSGILERVFGVSCSAVEINGDTEFVFRAQNHTKMR